MEKEIDKFEEKYERPKLLILADFNARIGNKDTLPCITSDINIARRAGSNGSMSASGSAGPGFDPRWGSKFSFENVQPRG